MILFCFWIGLNVAVVFLKHPLHWIRDTFIKYRFLPGKIHSGVYFYIACFNLYLFLFIFFFLKRLHSVICIFLQRFLFFRTCHHLTCKIKIVLCDVHMPVLIYRINFSKCFNQWMNASDVFIELQCRCSCLSIVIYQPRENLLYLSCSSNNTCKTKTWKQQ